MNHISPSPNYLLKTALANLSNPQKLNNHPWAVYISGSTGEDAGFQLVRLLEETFRNMIPSSPPRKGKRMDTRWGMFGILASQYFAPALRGTPTPTSLRDAWESIDISICLFVYGNADDLTEEQRERYRFAGNEIMASPNSTLSDWHRKGLEQLAEMMTIEINRIDNSSKKKSISVPRKAGIFLGMALILLVLTLSLKGWTLYNQLVRIDQKVNHLESYLRPAPKISQIPMIASEIHELRGDLEILQTEASPVFWICPYLKWVPKYGGDLSQAENLIKFSVNLAEAADESLTAITPTIQDAILTNKSLDVMDMVMKLQDVGPKLLNAQVLLVQAGSTREKIDTEILSPRLKKILVTKIDPLIQSVSGTFPLNDALTLVQIAPLLLGGGQAGPQTYLFLIQNEDELRPTGGFLTAAGLAVIKNGKVISMKIESSDLLDDFSKPYPLPPWQFEQFMNIEMLLFRDSNWFTNFPTTVSWAEYFYSYTRNSSADGVIALDMQVVKKLLEILGPVRVKNVTLPITNKNVLQYLRSAEEAPPKGTTRNWDRKQFIGNLAQPLLEKILDARGEEWAKLIPVLVDLLDEKHILLQFDNEEATDLLETRSWNGTVNIPSDSDYLMIVDTNMGYNKSNAIMDMNIQYNVDLSNLDQPIGKLEVIQVNQSKIKIPCEHAYTVKFLRPPTLPGEIRNPIYNIDECHWGYLRIYLPSQSNLLSSTPHEIPGESTMLGETIPARIDDLGSEDIPNAQVFGTMVLIPTQQTLTTKYNYSLPESILTYDESNNEWVYKLKVQKQPGIIAQKLQFNLHLSKNVAITHSNITLLNTENNWTSGLDLRKDLLIEIRFK